MPYETFSPGSIDWVTVEITYDDGQVVQESFLRQDILMP